MVQDNYGGTALMFAAKYNQNPEVITDTPESWSGPQGSGQVRSVLAGLSDYIPLYPLRISHKMAFHSSIRESGKRVYSPLSP